MSRRVKIATVHDCAPGQAIEIVAEGRMIALFHIAGRFHALDGVCPHQGGPLGKGALSGCVVTCPWHGWQFDVTDGQHQFSPNVVQPAFAVHVEGDDVYVDLPDGDGSK